MTFYTFVDQVGNKIYHRFIDKNGKRRSEIIRDFPINLYVRSNPQKATTTSLMGDPLSAVTFETIEDASDFIREYQDTQDIFGQTSLVYQFLSHRYPDQIAFNFDKIKVLAIDIETAYDTSGFPTPDKAQHPILTIACKVIGSNDPFVVFGTKENTQDKPFDYIQCSDEVSLLTAFQNYWKEEVDPDIVTGWNIEQFDIPYIINRCNKVMGEEFTNRFSPFYGNLKKSIAASTNRSPKATKASVFTPSKKDKDITYSIAGVIIIDYLTLYKKYSMATLESYRLDVVAKHELGMGKVDYSEYDGLMGLYEGRISESALKEKPDLVQVKREILKRKIQEILNKSKKVESLSGGEKFIINDYLTLTDDELDTLSSDELISCYNQIDLDIKQAAFNDFLRYNYMDVKIIEDLEKKLNFLFLVATVTYLGKSKYQDSFGVVKWWDVYIYNQLLQKNIQIPPSKKKGFNDSGIVGAFVKDPVPKLYSWIVTLDLTSLYPSIIMSFNLSPEMAYRPAMYGLDDINSLIDFKEDLTWIYDANVAMLANGATFKRERQGILPELVNGMFTSRKTYKNHMLKATAELEELKKNGANEKEIKEKESEVSTFNCRQQAFKISLNSLYGATANAFFRYNSRDISEGITMTGQLIIRYISKRLNVRLNEMFKTYGVDYIIFNDTDSIFSDGIIETSKGRMSIEDLWRSVNNTQIEISKDNYIKCPDGIKSLSYNGSRIEWNDIVALKKHKVKKRMYRITIGNKTIRVTNDHSLQVERDGVLIKIKPHEIKDGDLFIVKL